MAAVRFDASSDLLADAGRAAELLSGLYRRVPSNRHARSEAPVRLPGTLEDRPLSVGAIDKQKRRDGRVQFGTLGRGNHFVEFQADDEERLWLMVHSGSRGIGEGLAQWHAERAAVVSPASGCSRIRQNAGGPGMEGSIPVPPNSGEFGYTAQEEGNANQNAGPLPRPSPQRGEGGGRRPAGFEADSPDGQAYLADLGWAIDYAEASRLAIVDRVAELLADRFGVAIERETLVHGNHNHVRRETHFDEPVWVHRKGALSARADEPGVIPGSMGADSFHVAGRGHAPAMASCSHGAGRAMSRGEAARAISVGALHRQMQGVWFDHRRASALRDEAPQAYKEIHLVMRAQRELVRIVRRLRPLPSYKG